MTRIVAKTFYVLETERAEYRDVGFYCRHYERSDDVFRAMATEFVLSMPKYRDAQPGELVDKQLVVEHRLARLLAFWHRNDVARDPAPEVVICAALRLPDGRVIRGHRHDDCKRTAIEDVERSGGVWHSPMCRDQGFITSRGRYVDREEALRLQLAAGIPSSRERGYHVRELFSEDCY